MDKSKTKWSKLKEFIIGLFISDPGNEQEDVKKWGGR